MVEVRAVSQYRAHNRCHPPPPSFAAVLYSRLSPLRAAPASSSGVGARLADVAAVAGVDVVLEGGGGAAPAHGLVAGFGLAWARGGPTTAGAFAAGRRRVRHGDNDHPGLVNPVLARGDMFVPAGFSVIGACYSSARRLINTLSHTGDILDHHVPGNRFEHDSQTWATPTHRSFMVHHAAVTMARASWMSVLKYARSSGRYAAAADADRCAASAVILPIRREAA